MGLSRLARRKAGAFRRRTQHRLRSPAVPQCCGHLNRWYKTYEEAAAVRKDCRGYLLAYRRQYVVDRYFIETLSLNPNDPDWEAIGFDWVRPLEVIARTRLYSKLVAQLPREAA
jgi:hypothetical protein